MSRTFDDMPTLRTSPSSSPSSARVLRKSYARRLERCCCRTLAYFPLVFVHGVTGWAVWVAVNIVLIKPDATASYARALFIIVLYALANVSYSVAVFTPPGSPMDERVDLSKSRKAHGGYEGLPTYENDDRGGDFENSQLGPMTTVTAKSSGQPRYCKKCKTIKPDRAHHCSACGKCVLKMDHHCPWLATCVGLRNYKSFLLFLIYTSIFCWTCFLYAIFWVWAEIINDVPMEEGMLVVNTILLAVLGGVIGLVLSGFTGWHIYLTLNGQTTIESLEKTRYLTTLQKTLEVRERSDRTYITDEPNAEASLRSLGNHLKEIHANALPGVLRPEEGEADQGGVTPSPRASPSRAKDHLMQSYAALEAQRERDRYDAYLNEQDSERLPNAFNLGWKRNFVQVFGHPVLLWFFPVANSCGDGWQWEVSPKWHEARNRVASERALRDQEQRFQGPSTTRVPPPGHNWAWQNEQSSVAGQVPRGPPPRVSSTPDGRSVPLQPMGRHRLTEDAQHTIDSETSSDDSQLTTSSGTSNWNDVPEDYLRSSRDGIHSNRGRSSAAQSGKGKDD